MLANLSKDKRQKMLDFLNTIRAEHKEDDSILMAINEIETELCEKKFGLIWEQHEEAVDVQMRENIPVFTECEDREIAKAPDKGYNFILEGDNLHSLRLLEKTHAGRIDLIYIDPPYNTGNKDFKYDDVWVDKEDGYRHSKWLSFMEVRLRIANKLLSKNGVVFISIGDIELSQLKLLCDEIFGEDNFIALLPRVTKKSGKDHCNTIANNHDYVLVYASDTDIAFHGKSGDDENYPYRDEYFEQRGGYKLNEALDYNSLWYNPAMDIPLEFDGRIFYPGGSKAEHDARHNGQHNPKDWVWRWSKAKFDFGCKNGFVVLKHGRNRDRIYTKTYCNASIEKDDSGYFVKCIERETKMSSLEFVDNKYSNDNAKKDLAQYLDENAFDFPKPVNLVKSILALCSSKNSIILDFFAGSGTTGQAVMELNKEDGGNRRFILCTNNENNICEEVTYERIKRVIDGYGSKQPIPANVKYFHTDFVPKSSEDLKTKLLEHIVEMVELENGIKIDGRNYRIVLSDEEADELEQHWSEYSDLKALYVSSDVLFTTSQKTVFSNVMIHLIPDYYFKFEMQEVGEI